MMKTRRIFALIIFATIVAIEAVLIVSTTAFTSRNIGNVAANLVYYVEISLGCIVVVAAGIGLRLWAKISERQIPLDMIFVISISTTILLVGTLVLLGFHKFLWTLISGG